MKGISLLCLTMLTNSAINANYQAGNKIAFEIDKSTRNIAIIDR